MAPLRESSIGALSLRRPWSLFPCTTLFPSYQELYRMAQGKVKWFNDAKGFGFLQQESGPDVFVHHTAIASEGFRSLAQGDVVELEVKEGPKGLQAASVRKIG